MTRRLLGANARPSECEVKTLPTKLYMLESSTIFIPHKVLQIISGRLKSSFVQSKSLFTFRNIFIEIHAPRFSLVNSLTILYCKSTGIRLGIKFKQASNEVKATAFLKCCFVAFSNLGKRNIACGNTETPARRTRNNTYSLIVIFEFLSTQRLLADLYYSWHVLVFLAVIALKLCLGGDSLL